MFRTPQENRLEIIATHHPIAAAYFATKSSEEWYYLPMDEISKLEKIIADQPMMEAIFKKNPNATLSQLSGLKTEILYLQYPNAAGYLAERAYKESLTLEEIIGLDRAVANESLTALIIKYYPKATIADLITANAIKDLEKILSDKSLMDAIFQKNPNATISELPGYATEIFLQYPSAGKYLAERPSKRSLTLDETIGLDHAVSDKSLTDIIFKDYPEVTTDELIALGVQRDAHNCIGVYTGAYNLQIKKFKEAVLTSKYSWNEFFEVITQTTTSAASKAEDCLEGPIGQFFAEHLISLKDILALTNQEIAILSHKAIVVLILENKLTVSQARRLTKNEFANLSNTVIAALVLANTIETRDAASLSESQAKFLSYKPVARLIFDPTTKKMQQYSVSTMLEVYNRTVANSQFENAHINFALSKDVLPLALNNEINHREFDSVVTRYFSEGLKMVGGELVEIDRSAEMKSSLASIQLNHRFINACDQNNILQAGREAVLAVTDKETFLQHIVVPDSAEATIQNVQEIQRNLGNKHIKAFFDVKKDLLPACFQHNLMTLSDVMNLSEDRANHLRNVLNTPELLNEAKSKAANNQFHFQKSFEYRAPKLKDASIQNVIQDLDAYTKRIEQLADFGAGFKFFRSSRSENREANYNLAKQLRKSLADYVGDNPAGEIARLFEEGNLRLMREHKNGKNVIRSAELNRVIKSALTSIEPPAAPKEAPRARFGRKRLHSEI